MATELQVPALVFENRLLVITINIYKALSSLVL